jgi:hypothetical protein
MSESLNYRQMKQRAVACRSYRAKIPSSNSTTFKDGQTINIDLNGNQPGTYFNFSQMYLKMKVKNNNSLPIKLDRGGGLSFLKRVQISTAGSQLMDLNSWNLLATALMDSDSSQDWRGSNGNILLGTRTDLRGEEIAATSERTFCIPMVLNVLANTTPHRLVPACSLGAIQFKLTLEDYVNCGVFTDASVNKDESFTFSDVEMVCLMTELSPGAQAQVDQMNGGQYNILATSWMNSGANLAAGNTTLTANLGISVSSLERIIMVCRPSSVLNQKGRYSLGHRTQNKLKKYQFIVNSEGYPARPIEVDERGAEVYAEYLISNHSLVNFREGCGLQNGAVKGTNPNTLVSAFNSADPDKELANPYGYQADINDGDDDGGTTAGVLKASGASTESDISTFLASVEFESALSDGKSSTLYSGISTISSTTQFRGEYGDNCAKAQLDFFAQYSVLLSLDMRGTGVWSISI